MALIKRSEMKTMLWKNGRGTTTDVAIFPALSSLESGDFTWRISGSAPVECIPNGVVKDLGVIFNANEVKAEMRVISQNRIELDRGVHVLFCTGVEFKIGADVLSTADAFRVDASSKQVIDITWADIDCTAD